MTCPYAEICGGCLRRGMSEEQYRETKTAAFRRILSGIKADFAFGEPVFVADGSFNLFCSAVSIASTKNAPGAITKIATG